MTLPLSHIHRRIARISTGIRSQGGVGKSLLINGLCGQMLATAVKPLRKGCSCFSLPMLSYNQDRRAVAINDGGGVKI